MTYTQVRPPVIKANLGDLADLPPICTVVTAAGAVVQTGLMVRVPNTPMWYFPVTGSLLSGTRSEYFYYVSDGDGDVLDEGEFSVEDKSTGIEGAIITKDFVCPSVIGTPAQVAGVKTYTISFIPAAADGTFVSGVTAINNSGVGPAISLSFKDPINAATYNVSSNMSLSNSVWEYAWAVTYDTPADIVKVTISCEHNGKQYVYVRNTEIIKPKEFNPQRLSVGTVG